MNIMQRELRSILSRHPASALAQAVGVSQSFISSVLSGRKRPGPKLLTYLGLEAYTAYRRARRPPALTADGQQH